MPPDPPAEAIPIGVDGFYHPTTEAQLIALVKQVPKGGQLRVRGAAHSVAHAIYADPLSAIPNKPNWQTPPTGSDSIIEVMLDGYAGWSVRGEPADMLVDADAGIHLGKDPNDPTGKADDDQASLLVQLWNKGDNPSWTLSDLGGITHQTISGFTATGSSGGSLTYSASDDLYGFRVIDGAGNVQEFTRDDADPSMFYAMAPNLGLQGVVSKVILKCVDAFNISGQESVTTVDGCAIDLFGSGTPTQPSLEQHLRTVEYTRIVWWPQPGADRVLVWQAKRIPADPGFTPNPYREFGNDHPDVEEVLLSIVLTILGNLDNLDGAIPQITRTFDEVDRILVELLEKVEKLNPIIAEVLADFIRAVGEIGVEAAIDEFLKPVAGVIKEGLPLIFPTLVAVAIPLDTQNPDGKPQQFTDYSWHGLPMDNAAKDQLLPTGFTEIWVPLPRTLEVMKMLGGWFNAPDFDEAYRRTGLYAWEFYAAKASPFWLSPSYTNGTDVWREGAFRIDPYWFEGNAGDPARDFYPQLWKLFVDAEIPFRLHWGKYQPIVDAQHTFWVEFFESQYSRWNNFLTLRRARDPGNIFLTSYWRDRFGLWNDPNPGG